MPSYNSHLSGYVLGQVLNAKVASSSYIIQQGKIFGAMA